MTFERERRMLTRFEFEIVGFDLYEVIILVVLLYDLNKRSRILLVHCSLRQTWDHIEPGVNPHSCRLY